MTTAAQGGVRGLLLAVVFALAVGLWHGATVNPGHTWWGMDDFTAYLIHGRNLMAGQPYDDIATVTDPALPPSMQRKAFPPVFSLLVAWADLFSDEDAPPPRVARGRDAEVSAGSAEEDDDPRRGLPDLVAIKRLLAAFFTAMLVAVYLAVRRAGSPPVVAATLLFLGTSPYLFAFRELVFSETVFLTWLFAWAAVVQRLGREDGGGRSRYSLALLGGVLMALAYGTRTAALAMGPAVVLLDLVTTRRVRLTTVVMLVVAAAGFVGQRAMMPAVEGGYLAKAANEFGLATIVENVQQLRWNLERFFANGVSTPAATIVAGLTVLLAAVGFVVRLRRPTILEAFAVTYGGMILVLPTDSAWFRYLMPVLPMYLLWTFTGAEWLGGRGWTALAARRRRVALAVPAVILGLTWTTAHAQLALEEVDDGLLAPSTVEVFHWVTQNTGPDQVIVFSKSRAMTLATERPSISYPRRFEYGKLSDDVVWRHFRAIRARYLVLKHSPARSINAYNMMSHTDAEFMPFVERAGSRLVEVFRNADFAVWEIRPSG